MCWGFLSKWKLALKRWWAKYRLKECIKSEQIFYQKDLEELVLEKPRILDMEKSADSLMFFGQDQLGNSLLLQILRRRKRESEVWLILRLQDGRIFTLADHPDTQIFNVRGDSFQAAGLSFEAMIPFRTIRINFNGLLRPNIRKKWSTDYEEGELVAVKFNFIFSCKSKPLYWPYDWNLELMATALAETKWVGFSFLDMLTEPDSRGYDQFGSLRGELLINNRSTNSFDRAELNLPGFKMRRWGPLQATLLTEFGYFICVCADGMVFVIGAFSSQESLKHAQFGSVIFNNGKWDTINWTSFHLSEISQENALRESILLKFRVHDKVYKAEIRTQRRNKVTLFRGRPINWVTDCYPVNVVVNGEVGHGIRIHSRLEKMPGHGSTTVIPIYKTLNYYTVHPEPEKFIYLFYEEAARSVLVSGGKGASLAMLAILALSSDMADNFDLAFEERPKMITLTPPEIAVPDGFIVSVSANVKIIQQNVIIDKNIERLNILAGQGKDIQMQCTEIVAQLNEVDMDTEVALAVRTAFRTMRESIIDKKREFTVAVRCSPTEDRGFNSTAGRHETFLGLNNEKDVLLAIKRCWASLYTYQNVQFRRQSGLPVRAGMAIVIQRMLPSDISGIIYTQNPWTVNTQETIISSTFGLGNLITSGEIEPDKYTIRRSYDSTYLSVIGRVVGSKRLVTSLKKGIVGRRANSTQKGATLGYEMAVKLARIGIVLEKLYAHPLDIEWAIFGNQINIFQCKKIIMNEFTDWELKHEFDSPVMSNEDFYTTANVQEEFPHAITLPTMFFVTQVDHVLKKLIDKEKNPKWEVHRFMPCFNYHVFLDVFNFNLRNNRTKMTVTDMVLQFALMGKEYITPEIHKIALKRYPPVSMKRFRRFYHYVRSTDYISLSTKLANDFKGNYSVNNLMDFESAAELLVDLDKHFWRVKECSRCHYKMSILCIFYEALAIMVLAHPAISTEVLSDIQLIMTGIEGTVSADIPKRAEELMRLIIMSNRKNEFCTLDRAVAVEWLRTNVPPAGGAFDEFIQLYKHRGMEEMDLFSTTWGMDPGQLIEIFQRMLVNIKTVQELNNYKERLHYNSATVVKELKSKKNWVTNWLLKMIIVRAKKSVLDREMTLNNLVAVLYEFRVALWFMAGLMVRQGFIMTPDLLFFMTPEEWKIIITRNGSAIVKKAAQRKKIYYQLNEERFLEFNFGVPRPLTAQSYRNIRGKTLIGTSVYGGFMTGRAAVVKHLSETWKIQAGDILIARGTDIGWSPYFPILKGIVTELGGLLSHGTIMAREYGLPCVVAAEGATSFFQHGERVTLDADNGTVFKAS